MINAFIDNNNTELHPVAYAAIHKLNINAVIDAKTGEKREYRHLITNPETEKVWGNSMYCELGRLAQGTKRGTIGTDTLKFINKNLILQGRKVTYLRIVVDIREHKEVKERVRITVGGDKVSYPVEVTTRTADTNTVKIHLNSTISNQNAHFVNLDLANFYLEMPMERKEYAKMRVADIPNQFMDEYNLHDLAVDGYVYV